MSAEQEIEFLERLYRIEVPIMNQELNRLAENVSDGITKAAERAGRDDLAGFVCFYCGQSATDIKLKRCNCAFPEAFGCGLIGRKICADCESAHKAVAAHLKTLFSLPRVNRVNSRRLQAWRTLSRAARALYDEDANPCNCRLCYELAHADEFGSPVEKFLGDVLAAFRKTRFLDFQALAKNLKEQENEAVIRTLLRTSLVR